MIKDSLKPFLLSAFNNGWRCVPLYDNNKPQIKEGDTRDSVLVMPVRNNPKQALADAETLWEEKEVGSYGIICGEGLLAIDVDLDKPEAQANYDKHEWPETFEVGTPSGGFHAYYRVPPEKVFRSSGGKLLGAGVEIKGTNAQITGEGSRDGAYKRKADREVADAPEWLVKLAEKDVGAKQERGDPDLLGAIDFLRTAGPAIEGKGGDEQTFKVAQTLVRHNLSRESMLDLMVAYNAGKFSGHPCVPLWSNADLKQKVDNALSYSENLPSFDSDVVVPPAIIEPTEMYVPVSELKDTPPPKYLLDGLIYEGGVTWLVGSTSVGKTFVCLEWVMTLAKEGKEVLYLIGEMPAGFIQRLKIYCNYYGLDLPDNVFMARDRFPTFANESDFEAMIKTGKKFDLIVVDTFSKMLAGFYDLNSVKDAGFVLNRLDVVRRACGNAAIVYIHHTPRKGDHIKGVNDFEGQAESVVVLERGGGEGQLINARQEKDRENEKGNWTYRLEKHSYEEDGKILESALVIEVKDDVPDPAIQDKQMTRKEVHKRVLKTRDEVWSKAEELLQNNPDKPYTLSDLSLMIEREGVGVKAQQIATWLRLAVDESRKPLCDFITQTNTRTTTFCSRSIK